MEKFVRIGWETSQLILITHPFQQTNISDSQVLHPNSEDKRWSIWLERDTDHKIEASLQLSEGHLISLILGPLHYTV